MDPMEAHRMLRKSHNAITEASRQAVAEHLALAFYEEGDVWDEHVRNAKDNTEAYIQFHAPKIPRDKADFDHSEMKEALCDAIILQTLMNIQDEMMGSDDSRGDYMPDGIEQVARLTDDSYDGNNFLWWTLNNLTAYHSENPEREDLVDFAMEEYTVFYADCTSEIMVMLADAFKALN